MGTRRIVRARSGLRRGLWGMFHSAVGPGYGAARSRPAVFPVTGPKRASMAA